MAKVIFDIELPKGVTEEDLEHFIRYKFLGHGGDDAVISKFEFEQLSVIDFDIKIND